MKKEALYSLIHSLTPAEKRHIKQFMRSSQKKGDQKYLKMFDAMGRQKKYDEEKLVKDFSYQKNRNGFSVAKNYLYQLILRCLRNFGKEKSPYGEIIDLLRDVETLHRKKEFAACRQLLEKARRLSVNGDWNEFLLIICWWDRKMVEHLLEASEFIREYGEILKQESEAIDDLHLNNAYFTLYQELRTYNQTKGLILRGMTQADLAKMDQDPLLKNPEAARTPLAKLYFHNFFIEYYYFLNEIDEHYKWNKKLVKLFAAEPSLQVNHPQNFLRSIFYMLFYMVEEEEYESFKKEFKRLEDFKINRFDYELIKQKERTEIFLLLRYHNRTCNFNAIFEKIVPRAEKYIRRAKGILNNRLEPLIIGWITWSYYAVGDFPKALDWAKKMEVHIDKDAFVDSYIRSRFILLAIHYQLKDFQYLESLLRSTLRFLESREKLNAFEAFYLDFFKRAIIIGEQDRFRQVEALKELRARIKTLKQYSQEPTIFDLGMYLLWIDSQLKNKPVREIMEEQCGRHSTEKANGFTKRQWN